MCSLVNSTVHVVWVELTLTWIIAGGPGVVKVEQLPHDFLVVAKGHTAHNLNLLQRLLQVLSKAVPHKQLPAH